MQASETGTVDLLCLTIHLKMCNIYFVLFSFEDKLQTTHFPDMVFGESFLSLQHAQTGIKISDCISMCLMFSRHGNKRHCHLLKFLLQRNGSSDFREHSVTANNHQMLQC